MTDKKPFKMPVALTIVIGVIVVVVFVIGIFAGYFFYQTKDMHPAKTMLIKEGTFAIHGTMADMFAIQKDGIIVAFDAGDNLDKIKQSFNSLSLDPANVKAVFLTHSDADHLAGLPLFHNAVVYISRD
jgi:glyoxylase-like metal-dependent hydrolase (beta-lactamase superfamily II)